MGRTETIKQRAIYVYLPSEGMVEHWKRQASRMGTSISKFVVEHVQNSLVQEQEAGDSKTRLQLLKELDDVKKRADGLDEDVRQKRVVIDRLEEEIKKYRVGLEGGVGVRNIETDLVRLFRERGRVGSDEVLCLLGLRPGDPEAVGRVNRQLEVLEGYGLIGYDGGGWVWQG